MSRDNPKPVDVSGTNRTHPQSDEACEHHPLTEGLIQWFTHHGGQLSPDVRVAYSSARGFHMRATGPLKSSVVVTCPLKLTLSCLNLDPEQKEVLCIDSALQLCRGKIPDHILTYLLLIEQQKKGSESPWHAYIACLPGPESMTTPLWFSDEDIIFLAGTSVAPAAKERKAEYHQQWDHAITVMREAGIALADAVSFELLLWAATIFTSRAFISTHILPDRETVPILFPVVDILNHSVSAKVEWDFQPHESFSLKLLEGDIFTAGQEIFNNYAPKQNDELLLGYGFCLQDNPIEQFPLKLAYPAALQHHAEEIGLMKPESIPFGMDSSFLTDPPSSQHFLRAKKHPFGRYQNTIPFFRGIPPYIIHFFFIQTVLSLDLDTTTMPIAHPSPRITLQVLTLLHQALAQRCHTLPLSLDKLPANDKQIFANMYRDGQAKIIHSVRDELERTLTHLRIPTSSMAPNLLSINDALAALPTPASQKFKQGVGKHIIRDNQRRTFTLLLVCLATHHLTHKLAPDSSMSGWLRYLYTLHPLPLVEEGIEDADTYTFVDETLSDFLELSGEEDRDVMQEIDDFGLQCKEEEGGGHVPALMRGKTEDLGARMVMWGMRVVERECVGVLEGGGVLQCLYVETWIEGMDENAEKEWMYDDDVQEGM